MPYDVGVPSEQRSRVFVERRPNLHLALLVVVEVIVVPLVGIHVADEPRVGNRSHVQDRGHHGKPQTGAVDLELVGVSTARSQHELIFPRRGRSVVGRHDPHEAPVGWLGQVQGRDD